MVHRQVVYRLLPQTRGRWRRLERLLEAQRQLYNAALEERIDAWRKAGRSVSYIDQAKALTLCRRELPEMAADPVAVQRGTLKRLDEAYRGFCRRVKSGAAPGFPRFKGRRRWDSLSVVSEVRLEADPRRRGRARLRVPGFGWMAASRRGGNPYPEGEPASAVLKRAAGKWYAVVCLKVAVAERADDGTALGVDMNAGQVAVSGTGRTGPVERLFHAPDTSRLEARARRRSRKLARQQRGSRRRERTRLRLAKTKRRIAGRRRAWRHLVSRRLADAAHTVAVEDLKVKAMTASARGTVEEPGSGVRQKAGLNRVIRDTGWRALRAMLEYKAGAVVAVDPRNTSRTCRACGHVDAGSRQTRSEFECTACGRADHANLNAAANILALGTGATARGGGGTARPVNREDAWKVAAWNRRQTRFVSPNHSDHTGHPGLSRRTT